MRSVYPSFGRSWRKKLLLSTVTVAVAASSCSKDDPTDPVDTSLPQNLPTSVTVEFANPLATTVPKSATNSLITVVVPDNAATGPVTVWNAKQPQVDSCSVSTVKPGDTIEIYGSGFSDLTYFGQPGVGPDLEITRGVGEVWVFGGLGAEAALKLPNPSPDNEYLLIPHATNTSIPFSQENPYTISGVEQGILTAPSPAARVGPPMMTGRERFERHLWEEFKRITMGAGNLRPPRPARTPEGSVQTPAQYRQFNVLATADSAADVTKAINYTQVTAELRYNGEHCLIYADVDTLSSGNLTQANFEEFGERFDDPAEGIHETNKTYFGTESDVDGNGKVIVLISGIINRLPATDPEWVSLPPEEKYIIGGFFLPVDLFRSGQFVGFERIEEGTTNEAEVLYLLAADPGNEYLEEISFPRSYVAQENLITLAHEFQHLISISYRIFNHGVLYMQETWLEEGMSHMAENLNGMNDSNLDRANVYLKDPGAISLVNDNAPLNQRGGMYLFLRYLGDRFGETIYKQILQDDCLGCPCIKSITGEEFYDTLADFLATLYLTDREITSDGRYNYRSPNVADFDSLLVVSRPVGDGPVSGATKPMSGDFYLFTNANTSASYFTFTQGSAAGLRTVVVQTK